MAPATRYARNGDVNLAYQVHGDGPIDLLFVSAFISHVEHVWEDPGLARFLDRLAGFARLIVMDRRGSGLSDDGELSVEHELGDIAAVLDAAGSERTALFSYTAGGPLAAIFAARRPERVWRSSCTPACCAPSRDDDLPWLQDAAERDARFDAMLERWGEGTMIDVLAPSAAGDAGCGPGSRASSGSPRAPAGCAASSRRSPSSTRARSCRAIGVPTLVLHRTDDAFMDVRHSREYARRIPGARLVELPGADSLPSAGDSDALLGEIEEFLTGGRRGAEHDRALLTVLFSDIVASTERVAEIGDKRWRDLLARTRTTCAARCAASTARSSSASATASSRCSTARRAGRCAVRAALRDSVARAACRSASACTPASARSSATTSAASPSTSPPASARSRRAARSSFGNDVRDHRRHRPGLRLSRRARLRGVPGRWPVFALNG